MPLALLPLALWGCSGPTATVPTSVASETPMRPIHPAATGEPRAVVVRRSPGGALRIYPDRSAISARAFEARELPIVEAATPGFRIEGHTELVGNQMKSRDQLVTETGARVILSYGNVIDDGDRWLYNFDTSGGDLYAMPTGVVRHSHGPNVGTNWPRFDGDYLAGAKLWRLPDFEVVGAPSVPGAEPIQWAFGGGRAAVVEGEVNDTWYSGCCTFQSDYTFEAWDLATRSSVAKVHLGTEKGFPSVALSADGALAAIVTEKVRVVDLLSGSVRMLGTLPPGSLPTKANSGGASFSRDGRWLCVDEWAGLRHSYATQTDSARGDVVTVPMGPCRVVTLPPLPSGRERASEESGETVAESPDQQWIAALDVGIVKGRTQAQWSLRLIRKADLAVVLDEPFCDAAEGRLGVRFEQDALVVGDIRNEVGCGGRIDLQSGKWIGRFSGSFSSSQEDRQRAEVSNLQAMSAALGPPFSMGAGWTPRPQGNLIRNSSIAYTDDRVEIPAVLPSERWPVYTVQVWRDSGTVATFYEEGTEFSLHRLADAKLMANVVRVGNGAVALLSGGAVDIRGEIPPDTLFCLEGRSLKPWGTCKERFLALHAFEHAIVGKEDYLIEGAVK